jgi:LPXTG-motif cell wall-anchored protein
MNIIYTCSINEEAKGYPEAGESGQFSLTNNVDVYYNEDKDNDAIASNTITATIDRVDEVKKTLEKVGSWDDDAKLLTYSVEANPYGEDLVSDTATLTLTDELSYTQSDTFAASLLMDSVKLYYATVGTDADGNATLVKEEENGKFKEVESLNWSWKATETEQKNDSDTTTVVKTITAKIPDSTPVILEYQYHIQNMVKDSPPDINNSVSIGSTEYETSISGKDQSDWQDVNSDVNVEITPAYTLYKVDAQSYSTRLAGAKFALYGYSSGEWKDTGIVLETDKKGIISISKDDFSTDTTQESYEEVDGEMTLKLQSNVAYYLVEIEAPKGYNKLDNPSKYYFYCEQLSSSNTETHYPSGWKTSDDYGQAINLAKESATNYVENVRPTTNAQVTLNWTINNEAALEHPDSMIVYLNQYAITQSVADKIVEETGTPLQDVLDDLVENKNEETSVTLETQAKQVLSDSNAVDDKWVYTWTGLPAVGADVYYYYEVEVDMESLDVAFDGEWTSTCVDSCEQAAGSDYLTQINYDITNDRTVELYNLPATGGRGTAVFYILGVALMALALMGYVIIKTKKKKTNEK